MKKHIFLLTSFLSSLLSISQTYEWTKTAGWVSEDLITSITSDAMGNTYSTGFFRGTVDFDPGPNVFNLTADGSTYDMNLFVQKLDPQGNLIWARSITGVSFDDGKSITIDSLGNLIITGRTAISGMSDNIIVFKLDPQGNILFSKTFGSIYQDYGSSVVVDASDNIYMIGQYQDTVDFDTGVGTFNLTSSGGVDIFILKLNSNGDFAWVKSIGSTASGSALDYGRNLNIDSLGNLYITGFFTNIADFDPSNGISNMTSNGLWDAFIVKLNNNGDLIWHRSFGSVGLDDASASAIDSNGNVVITGFFNGSVDFDPGSGTYTLTSNGDEDIFILKLDVNGELVWAKNLGTIYYDVGMSVDIDISDDIYITGGFFDPVGYDPDAVIPDTNYDILIQKYAANGNLLWSETIGGAGVDNGVSIHVDNFKNIYVGGLYNQTVDFNPDATGVDSFTSNGVQDMFITKYSQGSQAPTSYSVSPLIGCDENIDGFSEYFDTSNVESTVLGNQAGMVVTYYDENNNLLPSPLPNPFTNNTPNNQNITIRVTNPSSLLYTETVLELQALPPPIVNQPQNILACDEGNGFSNFDTYSVENQMIGSQTGLQILYFDQNGNQLASPLPNPLQNTIQNQETITAQISYTNTPTCYTEVSFDLIIRSAPEVFTVDDFYKCDDNTDGIVDFDLSSVELISLGGQTGLTLEYYDGNGNQLPSPLPNPYLNSIPNQETLTVRIINDVTGCYNEGYFNLFVNENPIANTLAPIFGCDDDNNGVSEYFDTSSVENDVLGAQTGMSITYFAENGDVLPSPLPNPFTNSQLYNQNITIRITNAITNCFSETILNLQTSSQPNINQPDDLYSCDEGNGYAVFDTSILEDQIIGNQIGLTIHYYDSNNDVLPSPLPLLFQNTSPYSQTINVIIEDESNAICYSETSFDLIVNSLPEINLDDEYFICDLEPYINLEVNSSFDSYEWYFEDGTLISSSYAAQIINEGNYTLTVTKFENNIICENSYSFYLTRSVLPEILEVNYGELGNNFIEIIVLEDRDFEYSIDGIIYQESNYFPNIQGGCYTVFVRDKEGCGEDSEVVIVIDYPKFFTPNNDGYNDYWQIKGINKYPNSKIFIFDRYGKLLKKISASSLGWDGTYNGENMFSNDYWFKVNLGNGTVFNGHFSLKR